MKPNLGAFLVVEKKAFVQSHLKIILTKSRYSLDNGGPAQVQARYSIILWSLKRVKKPLTSLHKVISLPL